MNNYNCIIDFFESINMYDKDYFDLMKEKTVILTEEYDEIKDKIGFYPIYEENKMIDFKLYLPEPIGLKGILVYINQYAHALFPEDKSEIFPNILEVLFLNTYLKIPKMTDKIMNKTKEELDNAKTLEQKALHSFKIKCINYLK